MTDQNNECISAWCKSTSGRRRSGYCDGCYSRWRRAGRPGDGPGPTDRERIAGRVEDLGWLRAEQHLTIGEAAARLGVSVQTARLDECRLAALTPDPSRTGGTDA